MGIQLNVNPLELSQEQREAVAGFILAFPKGCSGSCHAAEGTKAHAKLLDKSAKELEKLAEEVHAPATPAEAFGVDMGQVEAAQAFGPLGTPGPTAVDLGRPLTAAEAMPALHGVANAPLAQNVPAAATAMLTGTTGPASSVGVALPAGSGTGVELDKDGLPWDSRIHVDSKAKLASGAWRNRKQLDPAYKAQVEAELRALMAAPGVPAATAPLVSPAPIPPAPTVPAAPVTASLPTASASPVAVPPAPPVAVQTVSVPAPAVAVGTPVAPAPLVTGVAAAVEQDARQQFVAFVGRASAAIQAGKISQEEVNAECAKHGVPQWPLLSNRLDLVPTVVTAVDALIASRG